MRTTHPHVSHAIPSVAVACAGMLCSLLWLAPLAAAATVDGLTIHSTVTGNGPTTVFLVHGYSCDETSWTEQVPVLAKTYRVVTLDLPGHGKSDVPRVDQFSMDLFARDRIGQSRDRRCRIVLAGHSMGTPVVLKYASLYPQHTAALVFVDGLMPRAPSPAGAASTGDAASNGSRAASAGARMGGANGRQNREAMIQRFFLPTTSPAVQKKVLTMMLSAPEATAVGAMNASTDPAGAPGVVPDVPMLGIYAEPTPVASQQAVSRLFAKATYVQVPGTGHFVMLEKPAEFNALLLEFLAKLPASGSVR